MRRFITYLYEYEGNRKTKNAGFIRVDERNEIVNMQVNVRNFIHSNEKGKIYIYVWNSGLIGVLIGEIGVINGQGEVRLQFSANDIVNSQYKLEDIVGIGICFQNKGYLASCWKDDVMDAVGAGSFEEYKSVMTKEPLDEPEKIEEKIVIEALDEVQVPEKTEAVKQQQMQELVTYQKMELNAIRNLPSPNWYLCNNRFLVHGFFNYRYLILKEEVEADGKKAYLGVPGVFEKPEMVMATLFGFSEFQTLPQKICEAQMEEVISLPYIEKSQEPRVGTFGCWLIPLQT